MILNLGNVLNRFVVVVNDTTNNSYDTDDDIILCCTIIILLSLSPFPVTTYKLTLLIVSR